jgi:glycosyltransferase involved in cell wall biosynthesis
VKMLLCHNFYRQRSGEDIAFEYMRELLLEAGHEVIVFSRDNKTISDRRLSQLMAAAQVAYSPGMRREIRRLARRERPAVAIVQNVFPLLSPALYYGLADAGIPIVQMVFNYRLLCANGQLFQNGGVCERCLTGNHVHGMLRRCYRQSYAASALYSSCLFIHRLLRTWRKLVGLFVVPDEFLGKKLAEGGFPAQRMRKVVNPFRVDDYQANHVRGDYALFVGRLIRPKGIYTLLDACLSLPAGRVLIAGGGEELRAAQQHPAVLQGKAEVLGEVYGNQMRDLLAHCGYVVVPSEWYDNLPVIVCQAFASGKPVIASRINGLPEFVKHEENGLMFPPGNAAALAAQMMRLATECPLYHSLSRGARQTAESLFAPRRWQESMSAVLQEAAAPS